MRQWKALAAMLWLGAVATFAGTLPGHATVTRVVDGDTIVVEASGKSYTVRLIGVDTPEVHPSSKLDSDAQRTGRDRATIQALGKRASVFTAKLLPKGTRVRLEYDQANAATGHRDRYKRLLAFVWTVPDKGKPVLVNAEIIRQGFGSAYTKYPYDAARMKQFLELQGQARKDKAGLWADDALSPTAAPKPTAEPTTGFVGSRNSTVYHHSTCRHAARISPANLVQFASAEKALAAGRRPCKVCSPPGKQVSAEPAQPRAPPAEAGDPTVYATRTGKKYHSAGCQYLRSSRILMSLSDAKARGLGPCSRCSPPR